MGTHSMSGVSERLSIVSSSSMNETPDARLAAFADLRSVGGRAWIGGGAAAAAWLTVALLTALWPDKADSDWEYTQALALLLATIGAVLAALAIAGLRWTVPDRIQRTARWLLALAVLVAAWEIVTAKRGLLPMPFFPPPQAILEVMIDDWKRLLESVVASLRLLAGGYLIGAAVGFVVGVAIGWSRSIGYWIHPILRVVGPLPATAWLPLAFFIFPSSLSASTFLIALATGFPVAVLTWSGVAGVSSAYYDVARTLGASRWFLVVQVAIPAALPHVFVGLFMGLGNSFAVLVVAEMLGVKAGLGWYLQWAQGWAAYANMYAALLIMALVCSGLITLLFRLRDRLLSWQKGLVRW
jgi:NitT/TauT family transport system permease protein